MSTPIPEPQPVDRLTDADLAQVQEIDEQFPSTIVWAMCHTEGCPAFGVSIELLVVPGESHWVGTWCGVCRKPCDYIPASV